MKKLYILAALLIAASSAANAGNSVSFEIEGHKVRIEVPRNCDSLSCIQVSAPGLSGSNFGFKSPKSFDNDDNAPLRTDPPAAKSATAAVDQAAAPQPSVAPAGSAPSAPTTIASTSSAPTVTSDVAPSSPPAASSAAPAAAPTPAAVAPAPVQPATTPLGIWATEENKGNVRVEQCGHNLCGYAVKTGEKVLINMKPVDAKWIGQIHDPDSGRDYDSTIAMRGPNALRVQGCAFGGMFCGGQIWKRVS